MPHTEPNAAPRRLRCTAYPGIYERGTGVRGGKRFVVVYRHRGGKQRKSFHHTLTAARAFKRRLRKPPLAFDNHAREWVKSYPGRTSRGLSDATRASYRDALERLAIPFFGSRRLSDIGPLDIREYIDHLAARNLSPASVRRFLAPVKAMLAEAYELELMPVNVSKVRVALPARDARPMTLTREQIGSVLAGLSPTDARLFEFLSWTGLRISEALNATWSDVLQTPDGPILRVQRAKTDAGVRSVALVPQVARMLLRHRVEARFSADNDAIFASTRGTVQDPHNVRSRLRSVTWAAGVPWATPHKLRHSLACELRDHGYTAEVIAQVLGHADSSVTSRFYLHDSNVPRFDELAGAR